MPAATTLDVALLANHLRMGQLSGVHRGGFLSSIGASDAATSVATAVFASNAPNIIVPNIVTNCIFFG